MKLWDHHQCSEHAQCVYLSYYYYFRILIFLSHRLLLRFRSHWWELAPTRKLAPVTAPVISASCHQFLRQLLVITGVETGGNWRRNWWQLAEIAGAVTGANWRSWHQLKSPYKSTRILDLISKKSYGKWKYEWYLSFHSEISAECHHIPLGINDFKTEIFWSEIDDLCSKISWMRGVGWSDEKKIKI